MSPIANFWHEIQSTGVDRRAKRSSTVCSKKAKLIDKLLCTAELEDAEEYGGSKLTTDLQEKEKKPCGRHLESKEKF